MKRILQVSRAFVTATLVTVLTGCLPPSGGGTKDLTDDCIPGDVLACRCPRGAQGVRVCLETGQMSDCRCDDSNPDGPRADAGPSVVIIAEEPGPCLPNCSQQECGPDPVCGVSCGTCPDGVCVSGMCLDDERDFAFIDAQVVSDFVYPEAPGEVVISFEGPVVRIVIVENINGALVNTVFPPDVSAYRVQVRWADGNDSLRFDFDGDGREVDFTAVLYSPTGRTDRGRFSLRFMCEADDGEPAPACGGVCARDALIGCNCQSGETSVCDDDQLLTCSGANPPVDCRDLLGDRNARGRCNPNLLGRGAAGCVIDVGFQCQIRSPAGETLLLPCGRNGDPDPTFACLNTVCTRGFPPCREGDPPRCSGDNHVYACVNYGTGQQSVATDCTGLDLGREEGECRQDHCVQPDEGGFCYEELVRCTEGMRCVPDEDPDAGVNICRRDEGPG